MALALSASLLRRRGNPGTKGRLLQKSVEAYVLSLETINRLTIAYRIETFCTLICNAWELLLKAKVLEDTGKRTSIYYQRKTNERRRSLTLDDALKRVLPDDRDSKRRNLERVAALRDEAVHLFISEVPKDVLGLLQACVINYHACLNEWFGINLAERVPVGMMTIVFDVSPERLDLGNAVMRRRLGKDATDYLTSLSDDLRAEHEDLDGSPEFSVEIRYSLALEKKADRASVVAVTGDDGTAVRIVRAPRDAGDDYPWRQKELVAELNRSIAPSRPITTGDVQAVVAVHKVKSKREWFYQSRVQGSPGTYSRKFGDWFIARYRSDADFLRKAREKYHQALAAARAKRAAPLP